MTLCGKKLARDSIIAIIAAATMGIPEHFLLLTAYLGVFLPNFTTTKSRNAFNTPQSLLALEQFSSGLAMGQSQEKALIESLNLLDKRSSEKLASYLLRGNSAQEVFSRYLSRDSPNQELFKLMPTKMVSRDSRLAGNLLQERITRFHKLERLRKQREATLRVISFRSRIMAVAFTFSLGVLTTILPLAVTLYSKSAAAAPFYTVESPTAFSFVAAITAYMTARATGQRRPFMFSLLCLLIYLFTFSFFSETIWAFKY